MLNWSGHSSGKEDPLKILRAVALLSTFCFMAFSQTDTDGQSVVPEPSMVVVMGAALAGIGTVAWRRNRKK